MKKYIKIALILVSFVLLTGFDFPNKGLKESNRKINPFYEAYEKASDEVKATYEVIPEKYLDEYITPVKKKSFSLLGMFKTGATYAASYDLRNVEGKNYVAPIDNQGYMALCWAFAANNALESYLLRHNMGTYNFSENQIDYVAAYRDSSRNKGDAGYITDIPLMWNRLEGPVTEDDFGSFESYLPYDFTTPYPSKSVAEIFPNNDIDLEVTDVKEFKTKDMHDFFDDESGYDPIDDYIAYSLDMMTFIEDRKQHIMDNGAITISMSFDYDNDFGFRHTTDSDNMYFYVPYSEYNRISQFSDLGHAVTIIGWNDAKGADINGDGTPDGAWLVQNSWGSEAANLPYFYISYYDLSANMFNPMMGISGVRTKTTDRIYTINDDNATYDFLLNDINDITDDELEIEIFKGSNTAEQINEFKFLSFASGVNLEIDILDENKELVSSFSETIPHLGTNTIALDEPAIVSGDKFYLHIKDKAIGSSGYYTTDVVEEFSVLVSNAITTPNYYMKHFSGTANVTDGGSIAERLLFATKNIDNGRKLNLQIFDDSGTDVTSSFKINNNGYILNNNAALYVDNLSSAGGSYSTEYYDFKYSVEGVAGQKTERLYICDNNRTTGSEACPFRIKTPQDLYAMKDSSGKSFVLANNIDLNTVTNTPKGLYYNGGNGWQSIDFSGSFDGQGYYIKNLYSKTGGLFNVVNNSIVKNLKLDNFNIDTTSNTGILSKEFNSSHLENVLITNSNVNADNAGGIAYSLDTSTIKNTHISNSRVDGNLSAGGIASNIDFTDSVTNNITIKNNLFDNTDVYAHTTRDVGVISTNYTIDTSLNEGVTVKDNYANIVSNGEGEEYNHATNDISLNPYVTYEQWQTLVQQPKKTVTLLSDSTNPSTRRDWDGTNRTFAEISLQLEQDLIDLAIEKGFELYILIRGKLTEEQINDLTFGIDTIQIYVKDGGVDMGSLTTHDLDSMKLLMIEKGVYLDDPSAPARSKGVTMLNNTNKLLSTSYTKLNDSSNLWNIVNEKVPELKKFDIAESLKTVGIEAINIAGNPLIVDGNFVEKVPVNKTFEEVWDGLDNSSLVDIDSIECFNFDGSTAQKTDKVKTGSRMLVLTEFGSREYQFVVTGDVTGDGVIAISDVAKLYKHLRGKNIMNSNYEEAFIRAGDVVKNAQSIGINDIAKLYKFLRGKISEL